MRDLRPNDDPDVCVITAAAERKMLEGAGDVIDTDAKTIHGVPYEVMPNPGSCVTRAQELFKQGLDPAVIYDPESESNAIPVEQDTARLVGRYERLWTHAKALLEAVESLEGVNIPLTIARPLATAADAVRVELGGQSRLKG